MKKLRWIAGGLGLAFVLVGCIWVLQGIGVLPGSVMSGDSRWAVYGGIIAAVGLGLVIFGAWPRTGDRIREKNE